MAENPTWDYDNLVSRMASISPKAKNVMDGERYRAVLETDDVTPASICEEVFICMWEDLNTIGVRNTGVLAQYYEDGALLDRIITTLELILPSPLYDNMRLDSNIPDAIRRILNGVSDEDVLVEYLDWIIGFPGKPGVKPEYVEGAQFLRDNIRSLAGFIDYLESMLICYDDEKIGKNAATPASPSYNAWISAVGQRMQDALAILFNATGYQEFHDSLTVRVRHMLITLAQPSTAALNEWVFLSSPTAGSLEAQKRKRQRLYEFDAATKLSAQYYLIRNQELTVLDGLSIWLWTYAVTDTKPMFQKRGEQVLSVLSDKGLLPDEVRSAMQSYLTTLCEKGYVS